MLTFDAVLPMLMGINIGASFPVLLSAIGATVKGRRAALVYLVLSIFGVLGCASVFYVANAIFRFGFMNTVMNPLNTAFANSMVRLVHLVLLAPFTDAIEALVTRLVPDRAEPEEVPVVQLEERFLTRPPLALEQSRVVINEMAEHARDSVVLAIGLLRHHSEEVSKQVRDLEELVDQYEDKIGSYLLLLNEQQFPARERGQASVTCIRSDFERISDHARNIAESGDEHEKTVDPIGRRDTRPVGPDECRDRGPAYHDTGV